MESKSNITIRPAADVDIPGIAKVLVDTWRSTFRGLLPDAFLDGMSEQHQIARYRKTFSKVKICCFVAIDAEGHVVGFCCGGPSRSSTLSTSAEIYALYVQQANQNSGLGRQLFSLTANQLLSSIGPGISVWVLDKNRFKHFYAHIGGKMIAKEEITIGSEVVIQLAYAWGG